MYVDFHYLLIGTKSAEINLLTNYGQVIEIQDFEQPHGYGTSILCPSDSSQFLNIELPILVVVIKNLNLHCRLQVQVADTQNCQHHFQFTNTENEKQNAKGVICRAKVKLETGWNKLELNLSNLTESVFKRQYATIQRLQICGNCRLRRIYFIDKHYDDQEICPILYHKFLDSYMMKWGIRAVERSTQTSVKRNKSKTKGYQSFRNITKPLSVENLSSGEMNHNISKDSTEYKAAPNHFLRNLQLKTDIVINEFFDRQATKLPRILDLKQSTKLKTYALPTAAARLKSFNSVDASEDALKKIAMFTEICAHEEEKRKAGATVKAIQDNWKQRYYLSQEDSSNNNELMKQSTKRTMLARKPKSQLLLSDVEPNAESRKVFSGQRKRSATTKRNESDTHIT